MTDTYIILSPSRRRRNWLGLPPLPTGRVRWVSGLAALGVTLPLAIGVSLFILKDGDEVGDDAYAAAQALSLPSLPDAVSATALSAITPAAGVMASAPSEETIAVASAASVIAPVVPGNKPAPSAAAPQDPTRRTVQLEWGDTLIGLLLEAAVPSAEAHEAMAALKNVYNPKDVQAGEEITLRYTDAGEFSGFEFEPDAERAVRVEKKGDDYKAASIVRPLSRNVMAASVEINGSLYESGIKAGIPMGAMASLVRALSYSVDFQRDIKAGDTFKVMYEVMRNPEGHLVRTGDIMFAEVNLQGKPVQVYRYKYNDGRVEYFDAKGQSVRKSLLRTPVNAARISSGFGMRTHPVMGYSRMHKGIDFAAPTGTPIYASGDGVVVERGWKNGYGNYVRIRHNNTTSTAYAHMSRFNSEVVRGTRVRQGQVIGYVGSTGRSTGPHLHYEVLVNNVQVNPLKVANLNSGDTLKGSDLSRLKNQVQSISTQFKTMETGRAIDVAFNALTGDPVKPQLN